MATAVNGACFTYARRSRVAIVATGTIVAFACVGAADDTSKAATSRTVGPDGVEIVESSRPRDATLWHLSPEPSLVLGSELGDDTTKLFSIIVGAIRLADGRIAVLNASSASIRLFDERGRHLRSFGGRGQGPGEFQGMMGFMKGPNETLVVNANGGRAIVFSADGRTTTTVQFRPEPASVRAVLGDGRMLVGGSGFSAGPQGGPPRQVMTSKVGLASSEGAVSRDSMREYPANVWARVGAADPLPIIFGARGFFAAKLDGFLWGFSNVYSVTEYTPEGKPKRIIRRAWTPRLVAQRDAELYWENRLGPLRGNTLVTMQRVARESAVADTFPAFEALAVDGDQNLWVRDYGARASPPGAPPADSVSTWSVFDPSGEWIANAELPARLKIFEIGRDYFLAGDRVANDVEVVKLFPLVRRR